MTITRNGHGALQGMSCLRCGATTSNGLALCELCQRKALTDLEFLPTYFANLARWRPGRAGSRPVPGSRVLWDGEKRDQPDRIRAALDAFSNSLTTWARTLGDSRPTAHRPLELFDAVIFGEGEAADLDEPRVARLLCRGLDKNLTTIATLDWAGEFVSDIAKHEAALRALTEDAIPGWYAGGCARCGYATYVVPGLTWLTCTYCGVTTYAKDRLPIILNEAWGWVARPRQLAEAIVALVDDETDVERVYERIRKWGLRDRIKPVDAWGYDLRLGYSRDYDKSTVYRYRLGDVLDRMAAARHARSTVLVTS